MSSYALTVIIASAFMHASWNLLVRRGRNEVVFVKRMSVSGSLIVLVPLIVCEIIMIPLGIQAIGLALISGCCCGVYFFGLTKGYEASDFTIVYPVVRALPVLLVAAADLFMGHPPKAWGWLGMALVVIGCFLAPQRSIRDFHPRAYLDRSILWMVLAAFGTVGYSLLDKEASDLIAERARLPVEAIVQSFRYTGYYMLSGSATFILISSVGGKNRLRRAADIGWSIPVLAWALNFVSYALIVWVYHSSEQVSYVVACRQFSIVIAVVAAFMIFREPGRAIRTVGALLITAGLICIGLWGD